MTNTHPWCRNIARDTAIRAAEDAAASERPPLPDHRELPERVARLESRVNLLIRDAHLRAEGELNAETHRTHGTPGEVSAVFGVTESLSADPKTEETSQGGLRTERVTLEIDGDEAGRRARFVIEEMISRNESVRVVPQSEADAEVERMRRDIEVWKSLHGAADAGRLFQLLGKEKAEAERDAALARVAEMEALLSRSGKNAASDGDSDAKCTERESSADAEPVAWGVDVDDEIHSVIHGRYRDFADDAAHRVCGTVVPLFRAPPPPRGWLTERDRQTMIAAAVFCSGRGEKGISEALEWILARNSPPRVRLPRSINVEGPGALSWHEMRRAVTEALAAAGVEVGE